MAMRTNVVCLLLFMVSMHCENNMVASHNMIVTKREVKLINGLEITIKSELLKMHFSLERKPLQSVTMECRSPAMTMVQEQYPYAEYRWKHNSEMFRIQPMRMVGPEAGLIDSGTYTCVMEPISGQHVVVAIYALTVGSLTQEVVENDDIVLDGYTKDFGKLYPKSIRYWNNPKGQRVYEKKALESRETVPKAGKATAGKWTCIVEDKDVPRKWTTVRVHVVIKPVPSMFVRARIYVKTHRNESIAIAACAIFVFVMVANCVLQLLERKQKRFQEEMENMKSVLGLKDKDEEDSDENIDDVTPLIANDKKNIV
ncbi:uncharacterized protein LOC127865102 isoform X2 [Dreissena polymorpha]|uniref:uncharacterized protein LOC127865102 isoform X2 n=1 Tax=Dreissena polymorpha TaxID=45954 RepID=UPI002264F5F3|nr:uncharacterized protein LOC127865102 isoform X2 [Dreissena polymorpha]